MNTLPSCLLVCGLLLAACRATTSSLAPLGRDEVPPDPPRPVEFETLARGVTSGFTRPTRLVIRSEPAWKAFWSRHAAVELPPSPAPEVDFARAFVVVVAMGERPSGGWGVEIVDAQVDNGFLRVRARESRPAPGTVQAAVVTHPIHVARFARHEGPVEIRVE